MLEGWRERARSLKREAIAVGLAARDRRTPWLARLIVIGIVAYAASPIDLIPDFIPVLGYLDELVLLPAALALSIRLIPADVMSEARLRAEANSLQSSLLGAGIVVALWLAAAAAGLWLIWPALIGA